VSDLTVEHDNGIARVWLDRPERRNALDAALIAAVTETFTALAADDTLRAVVLGGRGQSFCAGGDLDWMRDSGELPYERNLADAELAAGMFSAVDGCPVPVVARVHGAALAGGTGLACCCDIVLARDDARFGFTEVRLGLVPATIGPFALARIGRSQARALFLTGEIFDAAHAHAIGLVHELHGDDTALDGAVERVVTSLRRAAPGALRAAKALLAELRDGDPALQSRRAAQVIAERRASPEAREGIAAFFERREPRW
jgi:methylglutaconyl-CoA hydratase